MKYTQICPKCGFQRLLVVDRVAFRQKMYKGQTAYAAPLPVVIQEVPHQGFLSEWVRATELGHYESWTCLECGYTELFAQDLEAIERAGAGRIVGPRQPA